MEVDASWSYISSIGSEKLLGVDPMVDGNKNKRNLEDKLLDVTNGIRLQHNFPHKKSPKSVGKLQNYYSQKFLI